MSPARSIQNLVEASGALLGRQSQGGSKNGLFAVRRFHDFGTGTLLLYNSEIWEGKGSRKGKNFNQDYRKEIEHYRKSADLGNVQALNDLAWLLATCGGAEIRDGRSAVTFGEDAVAADDEVP